jgi:hypothetical protein
MRVLFDPVLRCGDPQSISAAHQGGPAVSQLEHEGYQSLFSFAAIAASPGGRQQPREQQQHRSFADRVSSYDTVVLDFTLMTCLASTLYCEDLRRESNSLHRYRLSVFPLRGCPQTHHHLRKNNSPSPRVLEHHLDPTSVDPGSVREQRPFRHTYDRDPAVARCRVGHRRISGRALT